MAASLLDPLEQERSNLGFITANIVHLQYYTNIGTIKNNEIVELVRELENPSEPNAIKVLNLRGKKLGHVEQSIAELLAPFMDNRLIFIKGFVPKSIPFVYEMPCQIFVSTYKNSMSKILKALAEVGLNVITTTDQRLVDEKIQYPKEEKIQDPKEAPNLEENIQDQNGSEELINLGLPKRGKAVVSSDTVVTPLSEHQKATLAWMVERENSNSPELPSFWHVSSEPGKSQETLYINVLNNFEKIERPSLFRGGVLAHEIGPERILILISLVATNPLNLNTENPLNPNSGNPLVPNPKNPLNSNPEKLLNPIPVNKANSSVENSLNPNPANASPKRKRDGRECSGNSTPKRTNADTCKELASCSKNLVRNGFEPQGVRKTTLVICSSSALSNWTRHLEGCTMLGSLKFYLYLGLDDHCNSRSKELCDFDVVLSTYRILGLELDSSSSLMMEMEWLRVILDEAQFLNSAGTKEAKAAIALKSQRRWAVISTPTGNTSLDVSLLLDFLKFKPSSVQRPVGQGSSIHPSDMQDLTETLSLRRTKELNEQSLVIRKAVINVEGSDGYGKDGQSSMEAKEIEEKKGEEEQEEVEETLYEMREVPIQKTSPKIENGAQARAYFGALFGDLEGPNFDLNITTSPLHDIVEGSLHADVGRLRISQVEDVDAGVADVSHQPIKIDSEASLDKCTPSYEDNQVEGGKKEGNVKEDGDNKDDNEDGIDIRSDSLGTMLEAAETSSLSRDQAKKLLLRVVNIALGGNDPWQERTNKLMEEINTMQVEMTSLRNCVPLKDEVVNKYVKCIQCEEWSEILAKAWEEVNRISGNQSGLLDVQSTNLCDDPVLAPSIYSLRWMTNMLKQRVEVELVYRAYGCDMLCQNEELTKSLDAVKEELVGVKEELEETKATLACSINTAKEERRFERRLREKMENDLADLRKENKQMKKEKDKILQASKILFEENKDLMKKLIVAGSLTTTSPSQAMVGSTSATVHAIVDL